MLNGKCAESGVVVDGVIVLFLAFAVADQGGVICAGRLDASDLHPLEFQCSLDQAVVANKR